LGVHTLLTIVHYDDREDYSLVLDILCEYDDLEPHYTDSSLPHGEVNGIFEGLSNLMDSHNICLPFSEFEIMETESVTPLLDADAQFCYSDINSHAPQPGKVNLKMQQHIYIL
jgi:hypothetical protein